MTVELPHGLACDGCGIANNDIAELENMQKMEDLTHELFANAARIHKAMRTNRLLVDVFRKYKHACREILQEKHEVLNHLVSLCDYCDAIKDNPHQTKHNLKCIQREISDIHDEIKTLEELQWTDDDDSSDDSDSDSDSDDAQSLNDELGYDQDDNASIDSSFSSSSSASSSSTSSDSDSMMDMATFH